MDTSTDFPLWSERYDRELKDVFDVQDEIACKIAEALRVTLSPQEQEAIATKPTEDLQAYDLFLHGKSYARRLTRQDMEFALQMFGNAVTQDQLQRFEDGIDAIGRAECTKLKIDPGDAEPLAAAMLADADRRTFLFTKVKQLWSLAEMTPPVVARLTEAGVLEHAGFVVPGIYQTLKGDLAGDNLYRLPYHQDHVLTRSHRRLRIWIA